MAETEAEVGRLEAAEVVYRQCLADQEARHPDQQDGDEALEEVTGSSGGVATPGAGGVLLVLHCRVFHVIEGKAGEE
ncbi:hypothetical protein ACWCQN_41150 [Streptomyces sp. NPDC001984]|uniref:hypothetical protein n=1 Tax=Streptomyces sp. NPDC002619 TaxID=3364655 RepID=UPI0036D1D858